MKVLGTLIGLALLVLAVLWLVLRGQAPTSRAVPDDTATLSTSDSSREPLVDARASAPRESIRAASPKTPPTARASREPESCIVAIRVISREDKAPISGVMTIIGLARPPEADSTDSAVEQRDRARGVFQDKSTDAQGGVRFVVPAGEQYKVMCYGQESRLETDVPPLGVGETREIVLELPTIALFGRVVADEDGSAIVGARVRVRLVDTSVHLPEASEPTGVLLDTEASLDTTVITDPDGRFRVRYVSWPQRYAWLEAVGRSPISTEPLSGHATEDDPLTVRLARSANVDVRVLEAADVGASDVQVRLSTHAYSTHVGGKYWMDGDAPAWQATTAADGSCSIQDLPSRAPLTIELLRNSKIVLRELDAFELDPGEDRKLELRIGFARVQGVVLDQDGKPVADHEVWLKRFHEGELKGFLPGGDLVNTKGRTGADGRFRFDGVASGEWLVGTPNDPRLGSAMQNIEKLYASVAELVDTSAGGIVEVSLRTQKALGIRGVAVTPEGRPIKDAWILCRPSSDRGFFDGQSDAQGHFVVGPLMPGDYSLTASTHAGYADSLPVNARAGDDNVVLTLRAGGTLEGRVVDRASREPCEAELFVTSGAVSSAHLPITDKTGHFKLEVTLPPGAYSISARTTDGRCGMLDAVSARTGENIPVEVTVEPGAHLDVRNASAAAARTYSILSGNGVVTVAGVAAGATSRQIVPAGRITLRTRGSDNVDGDQTIEVAVGETKEIVLPR